MLVLGHSPKGVDWQCALLCSETSCLPYHFVVSVKLLLNVIVPASAGLKDITDCAFLSAGIWVETTSYLQISPSFTSRH
jgi:hypothetical protein